MSLTVIRPLSLPSASTTGSFSILFRWRISSASRSVVPNGAVTRLRAVISAETGCVVSFSNRRSRLVRIPTSTPVLVGDRHAADVVVRHQLERVRNERVGRQRDGLDDHPGLAALHLVDLAHLILDREVALDDPEPALAGERDREARLGDGVHRRRDDRDRELDRAREPRASGDVVRQHARLGRHEQHVVERQAFLGELPVQCDESLQLVLAEFDAQGMSGYHPAQTSRRASQHPPNTVWLRWPRCACSLPRRSV